MARDPGKLVQHGEGGYSVTAKPPHARPESANVVARLGSYHVEVDPGGMYWVICSASGKIVAYPQRSRQQALYQLANLTPRKSAGAPWTEWRRNEKRDRQERSPAGQHVSHRTERGTGQPRVQLIEGDEDWQALLGSVGTPAKRRDNDHG